MLMENNNNNNEDSLYLSFFKDPEDQSFLNIVNYDDEEEFKDYYSLLGEKDFQNNNLLFLNNNSGNQSFDNINLNNNFYFPSPKNSYSIQKKIFRKRNHKKNTNSLIF